MNEKQLIDLANQIVPEYINTNTTLAVAESCTGGWLSKILTDVSGVSAIYKGGICSYSNEIKIKLLGVKEETLETYGAVSEQTAIEMATGLLSDMVQIGISTTGIAGPSGGSLRKPVGLVYIAITDEEHTDVYEMFFKGDREEIRNQARDMALFYAIKHLNKYY